jgi:hypothetical protein
MKVIAFVLTMLSIVTVPGCGARNIYDGLRFHQEMNCEKLQGADRDECLRRTGMSYDEYQRQVKEREQSR